MKILLVWRPEFANAAALLGEGASPLDAVEVYQTYAGSLSEDDATKITDAIHAEHPEWHMLWTSVGVR